MKKYKICVCAICKNEEKFVDSWVDSMSEADKIIVLDTGSTDNTVKKLIERNVDVYQEEITPWRFDVARNKLEELIPADIDFCCSIDLDERFEKGWRKTLENALDDDVARVSYRYTWNFNPDGSEGIVFFADKIYRNKYFVWEHPVHETLKQTKFDKTKYITIPNLQLNHYADNQKSRANYLPLLELSVKEDPTSDRNMHYLGREYYFYKQYENSIATLKKHLEMPTSIWGEERSSSCRIIASCYENLKKYPQAQKYFKQAIIEAPKNREPYTELAKYFFRSKNYLNAITYFLSALNIEKRNLNYISQPDCWDYSIYDLLALSFYYTKNYSKAVVYGKIATTLKPNDNRLINNLTCYLDAKNNINKN